MSEKQAYTATVTAPTFADGSVICFSGIYSQSKVSVSYRLRIQLWWWVARCVTEQRTTMQHEMAQRVTALFCVWDWLNNAYYYII